MSDMNNKTTYNFSFNFINANIDYQTSDPNIYRIAQVNNKYINGHRVIINVKDTKNDVNKIKEYLDIWGCLYHIIKTPEESIYENENITNIPGYLDTRPVCLS